MPESACPHLLLPVTTITTRPLALQLPRDVRRQLTFDRLLGARIRFQSLLAIGAAAAAARCRSRGGLKQTVRKKGICAWVMRGVVEACASCAVCAIKRTCRVVPYAAAGELVHALADTPFLVGEQGQGRVRRQAQLSPPTNSTREELVG